LTSLEPCRLSPYSSISSPCLPLLFPIFCAVSSHRCCRPAFLSHCITPLSACLPPVLSIYLAFCRPLLLCVQYHTDFTISISIIKLGIMLWPLTIFIWCSLWPLITIIITIFSLKLRGKNVLKIKIQGVQMHPLALACWQPWQEW